MVVDSNSAVLKNACSSIVIDQHGRRRFDILGPYRTQSFQNDPNSCCMQSFGCWIDLFDDLFVLFGVLTDVELLTLFPEDSCGAGRRRFLAFKEDR